MSSTSATASCRRRRSTTSHSSWTRSTSGPPTERRSRDGGPMVPLLLSVKVASWATLAILPPGILLGLLLARRSFPGKSLVETLAYLPLVLPPTAIGYLLLRLLARGGPLDRPRLGFDPDLLFTWKGAVMASAIMSLPLVARASRTAFEQVDPRLESMA